MLELRNITKRFGAVLANDQVTLQVAPGTIHAIVGENGAGKSTAMKIAYGFYTADSGEILVDGAPQRITSPHHAIALGIGMVHQHFMLVEPMTVAENVVLGIEPGSPWKLDMPGAVARIRALSQQLGMDIDPLARIETLAVGQQQRVELLKALYREARLILDDPRGAQPQAWRSCRHPAQMRHRARRWGSSPTRSRGARHLRRCDGDSGGRLAANARPPNLAAELAH